VPLAPKPVTARHADTMTKLIRQVTKLQSRTAAIDSGFPLATLPGVISESYTGSGNPQVYVNGSSELSGPYAFLGTYKPVAGQAVLLQPVGAQQTYVIAGSTTPPAAPPAGASTAWQTLSLASGWTGPVTYRYLDSAGINVQITGSVTLPSSGSYNDVNFATLPPGYQPSATRNPGCVPLAGDTYGNSSFGGAPHVIILTNGAMYLWGIPGSLNGQAVDISAIFAL
jgi:hypothetical protein